MVIRYNPFNKGHWTKQARSSGVREAHKRRTIDRIKSITALDRMADQVVQNLIAQSLSGPLALHFDKVTGQLRTEQFDAGDSPGRFTFFVVDGERYSKMADGPRSCRDRSHPLEPGSPPVSSFRVLSGAMLY